MQLCHIGVPFGVEELVFVVVVEDVHSAAEEAWEVTGPDEFVFAFFLEVDGGGDVEHLCGVGERFLCGEVGGAALCKVFEDVFPVQRAASGGVRGDLCDDEDGVHQCGQCVDDVGGFALECGVGYVGG